MYPDGRMTTEENIDSIASSLYDINMHLENFILIYAEIHGKPLKSYTTDRFEFEKEVKP